MGSSDTYKTQWGVDRGFQGQSFACWEHQFQAAMAADGGAFATRGSAKNYVAEDTSATSRMGGPGRFSDSRIFWQAVDQALVLDAAIATLQFRVTGRSCSIAVSTDRWRALIEFTAPARAALA